MKAKNKDVVQSHISKMIQNMGGMGSQITNTYQKNEIERLVSNKTGLGKSYGSLEYKKWNGLGDLRNKFREMINDFCVRFNDNSEKMYWEIWRECCVQIYIIQLEISGDKLKESGEDTKKFLEFLSNLMKDLTSKFHTETEKKSKKNQRGRSSIEISYFN